MRASWQSDMIALTHYCQFSQLPYEKPFQKLEYLHTGIQNAWSYHPLKHVHQGLEQMPLVPQLQPLNPRLISATGPVSINSMLTASHLECLVHFHTCYCTAFLKPGCLLFLLPRLFSWHPHFPFLGSISTKTYCHPIPSLRLCFQEELKLR